MRLHIYLDKAVRPEVFNKGVKMPNGARGYAHPAAFADPLPMVTSRAVLLKGTSYLDSSDRPQPGPEALS